MRFYESYKRYADKLEYSKLLLDLKLDVLDLKQVKFSKKMILRARAVLNQYTINEDGILCRIFRAAFNLSEEEAIKILPFLPPGKLRHKIITDCHDSPASGHYGTEKTYRRARKSFYWKGMRE